MSRTRPTLAEHPALFHVQPATPTTWRIVNRSQLAELVGCHADTVAVFVRQGMPVYVPGAPGRESLFDAVEALAWWRAHKGTVSAKEAAQTRAFEATARLNELKLAQQTSGLVPRADVIREGQAYTKAWRNQVRSLPRQARQAGIVSTSEQEANLHELCRQLLTSISDWKTLEDLERAATATTADAHLVAFDDDTNQD